MPTLRLRWRGGESLGLDVLWQGKLDRTNTARKVVAYVSSLSQTRTLTSTSIYLFLRDLIYRTYLIYCIFFWKKGYARSTDVIKSCTSQARDTRKALPEGQEAHHDGTITSENQNERSGVDLIKSSCLETALFYHPWPHPEHGCAPPHC